MRDLLAVERVLFVVHDASDLRAVARSPAWRSATPAERALCLVHDGDLSGVSHLSLQQRMTVQLRAALGAAAESIPTFVVSGSPGDDAATCAEAWGATRVVDLRGIE